MGERIDLLPKEGVFYKANLHSHTTCSDGKLTPKEAKNAYQERGYSIMAFTDHRVYHWHRELCDENFVALAACEMDLNDFYRIPGDYSRVKTYHINFYDSCPEKFKEEKAALPMMPRRYGDIYAVNQYMEEMRKLGFFACYNHPYWSLQNYDDYKGLKGFWGMEIYNYGCEIDGLYGYTPQSYDEMLRLGNHMYCVAADDNHNSVPFTDPFNDSFGGFTMIKAERLTYEAVIEALLSGHFYSSMGPEIQELYIEDGELVIKTSPVEKIYVITEGRRCHKKIAAQEESLTEARFALTGNEGYIRVDIRDERGLHANSNAYFLQGIRPRLECYDMKRH